MGADPTITNRRGATAKEGVQVDSEKMANMEALEAAHFHFGAAAAHAATAARKDEL
jgi:hypothetical protein